MKNVNNPQEVTKFLMKIYENLSEEHDTYGFYYGDAGEEIYMELMELFEPEEYAEIIAEQDEDDDH